jgi:hypothetical protein
VFVRPYVDVGRGRLYATLEDLLYANPDIRSPHYNASKYSGLVFVQSLGETVSKVINYILLLLQRTTLKSKLCDGLLNNSLPLKLKGCLLGYFGAAVLVNVLVILYRNIYQPRIIKNYSIPLLRVPRRFAASMRLAWLGLRIRTASLRCWTSFVIKTAYLSASDVERKRKNASYIPRVCSSQICCVLCARGLLSTFFTSLKEVFTFFGIAERF